MILGGELKNLLCHQMSKKNGKLGLGFTSIDFYHIDNQKMSLASKHKLLTVTPEYPLASHLTKDHNPINNS